MLVLYFHCYVIVNESLIHWKLLLKDVLGCKADILITASRFKQQYIIAVVYEIGYYKQLTILLVIGTYNSEKFLLRVLDIV